MQPGLSSRKSFKICPIPFNVRNQQINNNLEFELLAEDVHVHTGDNLVSQVTTTHLAEDTAQRVIQIRALILADMQHALESLVVQTIWMHTVIDDLACTLAAFLLYNTVHG